MLSKRLKSRPHYGSRENGQMEIYQYNFSSEVSHLILGYSIFIFHEHFFLGYWCSFSNTRSGSKFLSCLDLFFEFFLTIGTFIGFHTLCLDDEFSFCFFWTLIFRFAFSASFLLRASRWISLREGLGTEIVRSWSVIYIYRLSGFYYGIVSNTIGRSWILNSWFWFLFYLLPSLLYMYR